jgi:hypothetical protein
MREKRLSSKAAPGVESGALHESFASVASPARKTSSWPDLSSLEAKERRAKLIAEINSGWSEESECGMSTIAEQFLPKS